MDKTAFPIIPDLMGLPLVAGVESLKKAGVTNIKIVYTTSPFQKGEQQPLLDERIIRVSREHETIILLVVRFRER